MAEETGSPDSRLPDLLRTSKRFALDDDRKRTRTDGVDRFESVSMGLLKTPSISSPSCESASTSSRLPKSKSPRESKCCTGSIITGLAG
jgi:hypothetical protein